MNKPYVNIHEAYDFAVSKGFENEAKEIRSMSVHSEVKRSRVCKGMFLDLFEKHGILDDFCKEYWPVGLTEQGIARRKLYTEQRILNEQLGGELDEGADSDSESAVQQAFALKADLRDFLANNLHTIEPGLKLYGESKKTGVEVTIGGGSGRIDILAMDTTGTPVVIELKLSRGRNQTIGQLLYYMGWVDQNLGKGKSRGMIVAREISDELVLATKRVAGVVLFKYAVSLSVIPVQ